MKKEHVESAPMFVINVDEKMETQSYEVADAGRLTSGEIAIPKLMVKVKKLFDK